MNNHTSKFPKAILTVLIALGVIALILGAYRLISGRPLGLRSFLTERFDGLVNYFEMAANGPQIRSDSQGDFTNIVFLHHSTGNNLVSQGELRVLLQDEGFSFWDHGFNRQGLRDPESAAMRFNYNVPADNTDPDGLADIFRQRLLPVPLNTLSALFQHEVIVLKSCFAPANNLRSDSQVEMYKAYYLEMREVMAAHPEKVFVLLTTPPLNPAETNAEEAARARELANWLASPEFIAGQANIFVFDFFDSLAEKNPAAADYNMLRADFRDEADSHPNQAANKAIAPLLASFLTEKIHQYQNEYSAQ